MKNLLIFHNFVNYFTNCMLIYGIHYLILKTQRALNRCDVISSVHAHKYANTFSIHASLSFWCLGALPSLIYIVGKQTFRLGHLMKSKQLHQHFQVSSSSKEFNPSRLRRASDLFCSQQAYLLWLIPPFDFEALTVSLDITT